MWIRKGRRTGKGEFELMAPHGFEDAELRFTTNEHSGLMVQFEDGELSPQDSYRFERLEEDIDNIRVVRHPAGILKLNIVDEFGRQLEEGAHLRTLRARRRTERENDDGHPDRWNREDGLFRLSSIVPGAPVSVRFSAPGFQTQTERFTMKEGERRTARSSSSKAKTRLLTPPNSPGLEYRVPLLAFPGTGTRPGRTEFDPFNKGRSVQC